MKMQLTIQLVLTCSKESTLFRPFLAESECHCPFHTPATLLDCVNDLTLGGCSIRKSCNIEVV